jgi:DNA-directed RNA polymerase specialized sigma24 family protein
VLRLEGLSYQEIADITELTVSNVGVRIHRATEALKMELGNVASGR